LRYILQQQSMKGSCKRTKNSGGFNRCFSRFMVGRIMDCL